MEPTEYGRTVAQRVASAIDTSGLTSREIASGAGLGLATVSRIRNGKNKKSPDVAQVYAIARVINERAPHAAVSVADLMGEVA